MAAAAGWVLWKACSSATSLLNCWTFNVPRPVVSYFCSTPCVCTESASIPSCLSAFLTSYRSTAPLRSVSTMSKALRTFSGTAASYADPPTAGLSGDVADAAPTVGLSGDAAAGVAP